MIDHNQELKNKVNMYLDNALSSEDETQFLNQVQDNPSFNEILVKEKSFRKLIKNNVPRRKVSDDLIKGIMRKISKD